MSGRKRKNEISENVLKAVLRYLISKYELLDKEIKYSKIKLKPLAAAILEENREYIKSNNIETNGSLPNDWMSLEFFGKMQAKKRKGLSDNYSNLAKLNFGIMLIPELRFYNKKKKESHHLL